MVFPGARLSPELQFGTLGKVWWHARGREHCRGEPGSALSGVYAPGSAKAEDGSIVDEPGEGCTPVRENHRLEAEVILREKLMSDHGHSSSHEGQ